MVELLPADFWPPAETEHSENSYSVQWPNYDFSSIPTFAFASHGFDEWLLERVHIPDSEHLCIDDNGSKHTEN